MNPVTYEIIVYGVEALISGIFLTKILEPKFNQVLQLVLWCQIAVLSLFITPEFSVLRILFIAVLEMFFTLVFYKDSTKRKITYFAFKEIILAGSSVISFATYRLATGIDTDFLSSCAEKNCTYTLLYLLMFSIVTSVVFQFVKKAKAVETPWIVGTQVVICLGELSAVIAVALASEGAIDASKSPAIVLAMVCMVAANISVGVLAPYLLEQVKHSNSMDFGHELSNMEYKYYEMSVENDKKLASVKHDISNHIQIMYSLLENGENQKGLELIQELKSRYFNVERIVYCDNPVVNIILSNKKKDAELKNIEMFIKVKENLSNLSITDFDLSTIICNLIDNAIRGCVMSEQSHPRLIVEIMQKNQYLVVRVLNSCKVDMNVEATDKIESTKSKSQTHGIGMSIISGIAKKYRGDFVVSAQNGLFTATAVMSLKEQN